MNMNLKELMKGMGVQPGQVVSNPYARAFQPQVETVVKEEEDHEVSMAQSSLDTIIKMATELKAKMGENEKDIPAWIQDHITNAENFISQASSNKVVVVVVVFGSVLNSYFFNPRSSTIFLPA